jgi:hypothetical protein
MKQVIETGRAPQLDQLAELAGLPEKETAQALRALAENHGVILEPNSSRIWSLHPIAMMPTTFWVTASGGRGWWANCAWCTLGIAAAIGEDIRVSTRDGGEGESLQFDVVRGTASRAEIVMHLPYPPSCWWDNPYCPCANILFFSCEDRIDQWCLRHGRPKGAVLSVAKGIDLAQLWFGDYASPQWQRKTPQKAAEIFERLSLDPAFWNIPSDFR